MTSDGSSRERLATELAGLDRLAAPRRRVPAQLTRRINVTRPTANGRRSVGTTKLAGSFCMPSEV